MSQSGDGKYSLAAADFYAVEADLTRYEQQKLASVREFLAHDVAPNCVQWWNDAAFPTEILPKLAQLRLTTLVQQGYSRLFAGLVIAEMTKVDASLATFFMVHHDLFVQALYEFGSDEQRERYLADALELRTTGAFALTEPDHGSDVAKAMETRARRQGDSWLLNGAKYWIGNGTFCDHMLVWARDEDSGGVRGFIVDMTLEGVEREKIENKIALRTVQNAHIRFNDVVVAEADRLQTVSSFAETNVLLQGSRAMVAWQAVGLQLGAFELARSYALEREQFGKPIASFQLVQSELVTMLGNATTSMSMMVQLTAQPEMTMAQVALAKAFTTERMRETVAAGRSIFGGNGIVSEYRMAKLFADAEAIYTYEGTHDVNTLIAGRAATGISAFS